MDVLVWRHGKTREEAKAIIQAELKRLHYDGKVAWDADSASASVGWGTILSASGKVTDETIILDKCGGAAGGKVLSKCREILARVFPGGEQVN
jgi:hypothetical protein